MGLVVGKLCASSDRALAYSLLPTPPTEAAAPACSLRAAPKPKASKAKAPSSADATLEFDVDWIAEHARQVTIPTTMPFNQTISSAKFLIASLLIFRCRGCLSEE